MPPEVTPDDDEQFEATVREAALKAMADMDISADNWPTEETQEPTAPEVPEEPEVEDSPAESDEAVQGDDDDPDEDDPEAPAGAEDDVPTEYFGLDLSELPSEKRAEIIANFEKQDRFVQSVQRRAAELEKQLQDPKPEAEEPEPEPLTDDDIMAALGVSPDDATYDLKKEMLLPLAKPLIELRQQQEAMIEAQQIAAFEEHWTSTLDELEAEHGHLPVSREELVQIAYENNIYDPVAAYAQVHLHGRKALSAEVEKFKADAKKSRKKPPSTTRPRSEETKPVTPPELMDPVQAAMAAAKSTGLDWAEALK
jgi:hypothetical protein